jgi:hypothetical protein
LQASSSDAQFTSTSSACECHTSYGARVCVRYTGIGPADPCVPINPKIPYANSSSPPPRASPPPLPPNPPAPCCAAAVDHENYTSICEPLSYQNCSTLMAATGSEAGEGPTAACAWDGRCSPPPPHPSFPAPPHPSFPAPPQLPASMSARDVGLIVGAAVGGFVLLAALGAVFFRRRRAWSVSITQASQRQGPQFRI